MHNSHPGEVGKQLACHSRVYIGLPGGAAFDGFDETVNAIELLDTLLSRISNDCSHCSKARSAKITIRVFYGCRE